MVETGKVGRGEGTKEVYGESTSAVEAKGMCCPMAGEGCVIGDAEVCW